MASCEFEDDPVVCQIDEIMRREWLKCTTEKAMRNARLLEGVEPSIVDHQGQLVDVISVLDDDFREIIAAFYRSIVSNHMGHSGEKPTNMGGR